MIVWFNERLLNADAKTKFVPKQLNSQGVRFIFAGPAERFRWHLINFNNGGTQQGKYSDSEGW
jgi:hypothetical protein